MDYKGDKESDPDKHLGVVDCGQQSGKSEPVHENYKADCEASHIANEITCSNQKIELLPQQKRIAHAVKNRTQKRNKPKILPPEKPLL